MDLLISHLDSYFNLIKINNSFKFSFTTYILILVSVYLASQNQEKIRKITSTKQKI